jgi:hypothetical protein
LKFPFELPELLGELHRRHAMRPALAGTIQPAYDATRS